MHVWYRGQYSRITQAMGSQDYTGNSIYLYLDLADKSWHRSAPQAHNLMEVQPLNNMDGLPSRDEATCH